MEENYVVSDLPANPTMAQLKIHKEKKTRKSKAKACLYVVVSNTIFTRIMNLESAKGIWDYLKKEYQGNERTKNMQVLNLGSVWECGSTRVPKKFNFFLLKLSAVCTFWIVLMC